MGVAVNRGVGGSSSPILQKLVGNEGIWEVRIQFGNDIFRLLGFFDGGTLLILTNGFAKKTQKTPLQEIGIAIRRKNDYLARRKSHE
jgi:phage-related protein